MLREPTTEEWAVIRQKYEHTDRPVADICAEHGTTPNTLRDRVRRWGWTPRRVPIPREGPPPAPVFAPSFDNAPGLPAAAGDTAPLVDEGPPTPERLAAAAARVLGGIEVLVARLAARPLQPGEMERAGRVLSSLTRTPRELNGLRAQEQDQADDDPAGKIEDFRAELMRKINGIIAERNERHAADFRDP